MRQAYQRFASLAVRIRTEVEATAIRLLSAQRQAIHYKSTLLPLSQQILEQAQRQYNAMQVGVFQLLDVKQQQINTGIGYIGVLRSYWIARSQLDQILMGVLPDKVPGLGVESLQFPISPILSNNGGH